MCAGRNWQNLNAYDLHKVLINEYLLTSKGSTSILKRDSSRDKTDFDIIKEHHQFLWDENSDSCDAWEKRLAKKYYDKLYKEYCIADLSRYKENKVGMRWRTEQELVDGKGHFTCGSKRCSEKEALKTWEVNFGYVEQGDKKNALVKLRLCPDCSYKLNYHHKKKEVKRLKSNKKRGKEPAPTPGSSNSKSDNISEESDKTGDKKSKQDKNSEVSDGSDIWQQKVTAAEEKSRDDEFEEYLEQLFL